MRGEDIISSATQRVQEDSYFLTYTNEHLDAYTHDMNRAVHGNDVKCLRSLLQSGHTMQASNRFGESMLHTSCRRGFTDMVEFFIHEAKVSPRLVTGIFLGYRMAPGGRWGGEYIAAPPDDFVGVSRDDNATHRF